MQKFIDTYEGLNKTNLDTLAGIYSQSIHFIDPAHEIFGLSNLTDYFAALFQNTSAVQFNIVHHLLSADSGYVEWRMLFSHPRLKGGKTITVPGVSRLHFSENGLIDFHRDYFDLGSMIYEHIPVIGRIICAVKTKVGS